MKTVEIKKDSIYYIEAKKSDNITLYNSDPLFPIEVIGGPNGLVNFTLFPRSGIKIEAETAQLCIKSHYDSVFIDYNVSPKELLPEAKPELEPIEPTSKSLKGKSFYLDAGHGGKDPGAVNNNLGFEEKVAALEICLKLGERLIRNGATVFYSRTTDIYPSLSQRASEANSLNATAFISIHLNSAESKSVSGIETLCYSNTGKAFELAEAVQSNLITATGFKNRGIKLRPDLTVLSKTKMPAILCEVGFVSNNEEAEKLFSSPYQSLIANAIKDGVVEEFGG